MVWSALLVLVKQTAGLSKSNALQHRNSSSDLGFEPMFVKYT